MFMRTERLFLRPVFPEDACDIYNGIADFRVVSMLASAPWPYAKADAVAYCHNPSPPGSMKFSVTLPNIAVAPVIGQIGLNPDEEGMELGYWIGRAWQRRGYAKEAVRGILEMAAALGVNSVNAGHFLENAGSARVLKANGFVETGEIRLTQCKARAGEAFPARRYVCNLVTDAGMLGAKAA